MQLCARKGSPHCCIWLRRWGLEWRCPVCLRSVACACGSTARRKEQQQFHKIFPVQKSQCDAWLSVAVQQFTADTLFSSFLSLVVFVTGFGVCNYVYHSSFKCPRQHWGWQQFPNAFGLVLVYLNVFYFACMRFSCR